MVKCVGIQAAVIAAGGFRLWSLFSAAAIRRKIFEGFMCGVSRTKRRPMASETMKNVGSERLVELLTAEGLESGTDEPKSEVKKKKAVVFDELQSVVTMLQEDDDGRRRSAAIHVRRFAKDDPNVRETLAMLGSIPPLVGMLDSDDPETQIVSLYALLNLGIGNDSNKAAIMNAGALQKMLRLIRLQCSPPVSDAIVANFLGLSALDSNKPIIGSSGAIPFLVSTFQNPSPNPNSTSRQDALNALFNLSIAPSNISNLIATDLPQCLLSTIGDMEVSDRALAVLANLLSTSHGRRAVSRSENAFPILIDVLYWCDSPASQEKAAYILMIIAHKRYTDRTAMIESGIISSLLELTLLGTPLAQKRASRLLEILTVDKEKHVSSPMKSEPLDWKRRVRDEVRVSEERKALRCLVEQSLQCNMRRIVRRANLPGHSAPSDHFPTMPPSSSSKSLPF